MLKLTSRDIVEMALVPVLFTLGIIFLILSVGCDKFREKCEQNGGHIEHYNCRTATYTTTQQQLSGYDRQGYAIYISVPVTRHHTVCDRRCVGARPEAVEGSK